jgi:hypothetical protein
MKWTLFLPLLGFWACRGQAQTAVADSDWATTITNRLYERQLLNKAGRDELRRQFEEGQLGSTYALPGTARYGQLPAATPAAVLAFCTDAFVVAQLKRAVELTPRQERELQAALRQQPVDTAALQRRFAHSPIEQAIREEDPPVRRPVAEGWTIYPPLNPQAQKDLVAASRSVFGKTRTRTARDLYELGLLTQPDYACVQQALASQQLPTEAAVCQLAAQLALDRATRPTRQVAFDSLLLRLRQANVLTASGKQRALADPRVVRELEMDALLPYCQQVRLLTNMPRQPQPLYQQVLAEAAALLPTFHYTDSQVKLTETPLGQGINQELTLSFTASGRRYAHHLRLGWLPLRPPVPERQAPYIDAEALAGINQWLRDQHAPGRLYLAYLNMKATKANLPEYALVLLTPAQLAAWGEPGSFSGPELAAGQLTSEHIEEALALYQRLGLLASLSPTELTESRQQALSGEANRHLDLLRSFPGLVVATGGEDAEEPNAYAKALAEVVAATRGAFRPVAVQDDFPGQQARKQKSTFSFACGPRRYKATFTSDLGWMDTSFVTLIERAVRENTPGRLYYLGEGDETSLYGFFTPVQATTLRQAQPELFEADDKEEAAKQQRR